MDILIDNKTKIKICGIKRWDEVEILNSYPVSYAGFIFAKSKRQVDIERCNTLSEKLRPDILRVGVFVNEPIENLLKIIEECSLNIIQLHGEESVDYIRKIPLPVWKTISVKNKDSLELMSTYENEVEGILYETYHETLKGGTGQSFDWNLVKDIVNKIEGGPITKILAGGIHPQNALEAIQIGNPDVLDVNSGVEVDGFKTREKIDELFKELKL